MRHLLTILGFLMLCSCGQTSAPPDARAALCGACSPTCSAFGVPGAPGCVGTTLNDAGFDDCTGCALRCVDDPSVMATSCDTCPIGGRVACY